MKKLAETHRTEIEKFTDLRLDKISKLTYLYEFDREVQCSAWGYPTEDAYYRDASSVDSVMAIRIPYLAINSTDDPVSLECPRRMTNNSVLIMIHYRYPRRRHFLLERLNTTHTLFSAPPPWVAIWDGLKPVVAGGILSLFVNPMLHPSSSLLTLLIGGQLYELHGV
jgi:hypothetical protein